MVHNPDSSLWDIRDGESPLVATAVHDGHSVSPRLAGLFAVTESERLREEDPYTGTWARLAETFVVAKHSRFEVDLNRVRSRAVYLAPEDAWGLNIWRESLGQDLIEGALRQYDAFYEKMESLLLARVRQGRPFVVLDIHSYNHRRAGPDQAPADPAENPEVNIGTGTMDRKKWRRIVDRFLADLRAFDLLGRPMDVRENVKFRGGRLAAWTHETFPESGCVIAIEFKKLFMDEWTGVADSEHIDAIGRAIQSTFPGLLEELTRL